MARGNVAPKPLGDACHLVTLAFTQICSGFFFFNICWQSDFSEDQKWRVVRAHSVTFAPIRNFQRCQNPIFSIPPTTPKYTLSQICPWSTVTAHSWIFDSLVNGPVLVGVQQFRANEITWQHTHIIPLSLSVPLSHTHTRTLSLRI